ncbi:MAG: CoB--CoM heterodisulfide reductase iron-sulfur subunit B family protein [Candidatus Bathyarchaeia archaeon]
METHMEFSYYPGCSLEGMNKAYDKSARLVSKTLGIGLTELNDWNCCGASAYMSIQELRAHLLSARNLAIAEREKKDLVVVCPACLTTLTKSNHYMGEDLKLRRTIASALKAANLQYLGTVKVRHLLEVVVNEIGEQEIKTKVTRPLTSLKVAPYYGCQFTRPFGEFDDKEFPVMLDTLLKWLGAEPVNFPLKAKCCGGMLMTTNEPVGLSLVRSLLDCATQNGAECIATICPLCHITLEAYQGNVNKKFATSFEVPTLYFTQLMGLAFGFSRKELGINEELISSKAVLARRVEAV